MISVGVTGDPRLAEVDEIRAKIQGEAKSLLEVERAPLDEQTFRKVVRAEFDRQTEKHDPIHHLGIYASPLTGQYRDALKFDGSMIIALLGADVVLDRMVELAKASGWDPKAGLSEERRAKRIAEIMARIRELNIVEETAILEVEQDDAFVVARRPDLDCGLVLKLWDDHLPGTNSAHRKLRALVRASDQFHSIVLGHSDRYTALVQERQKVNVEIRRISERYHAINDGQGFGERHVARERQRLEEIEEELQEEAVARDRAEQQWRAFANPIARLTQYTGNGKRAGDRFDRATGSPDPDSPFIRNASQMSEAAIAGRSRTK